jgi:drug/metabolite transporter (DMT)-like permease
LVIALVWLGVVSGPIGTWTAIMASRALPTLVTSLGFLCVPLLGIVLSTVWLGEPLGLELIAGSALILLGLVLVSLG